MEIKLCAFADEYSSSLDEQIKGLRENNIYYIELRGVDGKNITAWDVEDAVNWKKKLSEGDIKVWSIGSPLGKVKLSDSWEDHLATAEKLFKMANILECQNVRMFSFFTSQYERDAETVFSRLCEMKALADKYGVTLCHENEKGVFGDNAERCLDLLKRVDGLKNVFDPANYVQCSQDIPAALALLSDKTYYYHIKDALYADGSVVPAGKGDGHLEKMISEITCDTVLTLEPHLRVFDGYSEIDSSGLKNKYTYASAQNAFAAAVNALKDILKKLGFTEENRAWKK